MSNICIIGHISIDKIHNNKNIHESIGGPPCYSGITCINEGHNIEVLTKVGKEFPDKYESWLKDKNIEIKNLDENLIAIVIDKNNNKVNTFRRTSFPPASFSINQYPLVELNHLIFPLDIYSPFLSFVKM